MLITPIKTKKVVPGDTIESVLDSAITALSEESVVVISAKIVAIAEGRVVKNDGTVDKKDLVAQEADYFILNKDFYAKNQTVLTINENIFVPSAGIDESNGNGYFILWPENPMQSAEKIWQYLRKKHKVQRLGIILSDSYFTPLRRGSVGVGIAWCGMHPTTSYIGKPDIFGEPLKYTTASRIDGLSAAAEVAMGEGDEQTPLAVITDVPFVDFVDTPPTQEEIDFMKIAKEDDSYGLLLNAVEWEKGHKSSS